MTRRRTFLLAAGLAAALALAGCGGSDESSALAEAPPAPPATTAETGPATTADTQTTETETEPTTTAETDTTTTETEAEDKPDVDVLIKVVDGERVGGKGKVEAKQGDHVRITVEVDAPQELHLHGYDLEAEATPNKPGIFQFEAELEGIFELESHASEKVIADVVVEP